MTYEKLDMRTELRRLASGKATHTPAEFLAGLGAGTSAMLSLTVAGGSRLKPIR